MKIIGYHVHKNHLKITIRIIKKQKVYSIINTLGLAVGMACCILIMAWVQNELSYDRFHKNANDIYRIVQNEHRHTGDFKTPFSYSVMPPLLMSEYPGIKNYVRFSKEYDMLVTYENRRFIEQRFFYADSSVLRIFDFSLIKGSDVHALSKPYSIVLTEATAEKYFGDEDPIGKTLFINNEKDYVVTGILKTIPVNSHMHFDFLASFSSLNERYGPYLNTYWAYKCYAYLLIPDPSDAEKINEAFPDFLLRHKGEVWQAHRDFSLQSLTRIHLFSNMNFEIEANGDVRYVTIFPVIAFFILLIACINFMNLSTAQSTKRSREISIRKVVGANRRNLFGQLLSEPMLFSLVALPIALLLVEFFMPIFNQISGKSLSIDYMNNMPLLFGLIGLLVFVGILSGSYPAFFLSSFHPVRVLKGESCLGVSTNVFRRILVVVQFSIFIVLIVGTLMIRKQLNFIKNDRLGFNKKNILVIRLNNEDLKNSYLPLKRELLQHPAILSVTGSSGIPGTVSHLSVFRPEGYPMDKRLTIRNLCVDYDFIQTMGINIKQGRDFSKDIITDARGAYIINEAAAQMFGWKSSPGRRLDDLEFRVQGEVVGLIENFHYQSKHHKIDPLVIQVLPNEKFLHCISLKINSHDMKKTISFIQSKWEEISPDRPLDFFFLDDHFDKMYRKEEKLSRIIQSFTSLTMFIACLGVFGLSAYTTERRTKEIGIRKILGASAYRIILILSKDFIRWIILANILSCPVAYFAMDAWLRNFAYRVNIDPWMFIMSAVLAVSISMLTMSFQTIKAAVSNPVDSLRYE